MKVLIVSDSFPPRPDGIAQSTLALMEGLRLLGHDALTVVPDEGAPSSGDLLRGVRRIPVLPIRLSGYPVTLATWRAVRAIADSADVDVVHVQTLAPLGLAGAAYARHRGLPAVLTWHTDVLAYRFAHRVLNTAIPASYVAWHAFTPQALAFAAHAVARWCAGMDVTAMHALMLTSVLSFFDRIIVPSRKARDRPPISSCPDSSVVTIESAVTTDPPILTVEDERSLRHARSALNPSQPTLVFVGRPSPEKNLEVLLQVLRWHVLPKFPHARLLVIGECRKQDERTHRRTIAHLGIVQSVQFVGPLPNSVVRRLLVDCDVLVMPSRTETQSLVILEAASAGIPAIILDNKLTDFVEHGVTGMVANSADEFGTYLNQLLCDAELRRRLGETARMRVLSYGPTGFARRVSETYSQIGAELRLKPQSAPFTPFVQP